MPRRGREPGADEAANLIGDSRGFRTARLEQRRLAAIAVWFEDEDLANAPSKSQRAARASVARLGRDGCGTRRELPSLRAARVLTGARWRGSRAWTSLPSRSSPARVRAALPRRRARRCPTSRSPRGRIRVGVSLAQPAYLELWRSAGKSRDAGCGSGMREIESWLGRSTKAPATAARAVGVVPARCADPHLVSRSRIRRTLSWWAVLFMSPKLARTCPHVARSLLLESQGLRRAAHSRGGRYVSLECGRTEAGMGPDRLHLTPTRMAALAGRSGNRILLAHDLFWYRSTLAHNAPRLDGASQSPAPRCARRSTPRASGPGFASLRRDRAHRRSGPGYVLDVVELASRAEHTLELPWHFSRDGRAERGRDAGRSGG